MAFVNIHDTCRVGPNLPELAQPTNDYPQLSQRLNGANGETVQKLLRQAGHGHGCIVSSLEVLSNAGSLQYNRQDRKGLELWIHARRYKMASHT